MRAILTYHSIDGSGSVISVDEETFRHQADWLAAGHVSVVSVPELLEMNPRDEGLAITFDDAFENFGGIAWPILRERELPASVFIVAGHVGGSNDWGGSFAPDIPELPLLDWSGLEGLAEDGVAIGSHTSTHPHLADQVPARVEEEVTGAAAEIERRLGVRPEGFAYPYGSVGEVAERVVSRTHAWACTTELAPLRSSDAPHRLPRLDAYYFRRAGQLESWGSPRFRARLGIRQAARTVRARVTGGPA